MCDACEQTPTAHDHHDHHDPRSPERRAAHLDRRALLRRAGIGGVAAAAGALWLPDALAEAVAPPFESVQLAEDHLSAALPVVAPAVPEAAPSAKKRSAGGGVGAPAIVTRAEWGADESMRTAARGFAPLRKFVVHHTASRNQPKDPVQVVRDMYRYHVQGRQFADLGYNFVIDHRGVIYEGRWARPYGSGERHDGEDGNGLSVVGAHSLGMNAGTCGIVLIGDFTKGKPTAPALGALIQLIAWKASLHQVDGLGGDDFISFSQTRYRFPNIAGHRDVGLTVCPGPALFNQLGWIRNEVVARAGRFDPRTIDMSTALRRSDGETVATTPVSTGPNAANPTGAKLTGYRLLTSDGRVITLGRAATLGSPRELGLGAPTAIAGVPGRNAYLTSDAAGRVAGFGGAASGAPKAAVTTAAMASTPSGQGYWVLASTGGVYAFGSARHHGSLIRSGVSAGGLKIRSTPSGNGYWILAGNGRIYPFGDATKFGAPSAGAVDFWPTSSGAGYWVLLADGRVGAYGDAGHFGDVPGLKVRWAKPAVAIIGMPSGRGYAIAARDGGVFNFGSSPFLGSLGGSGRNVVGMALAFG